MFSILCLAVSAMVCDIYLILHHSINIGWKKEMLMYVSADSYFSHLYRFSCILSFLVLRHIRNVLLWLLMQQRLFNAKLLLKICSILFYCIFVTFLPLLLLFSFVSNVIGCASLGQMLHWICTWESHARLYYNTLYREHPHFNINYIITSTIPTINTTKNERIIMYGRERKSSSSSKIETLQFYGKCSVLL